MIKLTWENIEQITDELAIKIKTNGFKPDYMIGITMGGLIPLYFLAKKLDATKNILTISTTSYDKDKKKDPQILYLPRVDMEGKKVMLVDEIADTGKTLKEISDVLIDRYKVSELKTATLVVKIDTCEFNPDFFGVEKKEGWVVFPWEKYDFPEYFE
ncbi:MAG: hypothetical protein COU46_03440 [Candidatus Niyogibacteria bacterium CG10_big_fil_rev_8_21_14_0_10_42_19]|uniref:Phosphoribosyltransferase domain-containing protein n=1 Tax=Candidatus Niyogibacteria bacterium CG10_big_fil_rev_8_21_14_0_10_42_19 TaxID=1974725 RepID=A0A2H0TEX4_9BACT|nr:MAG: hypothetical protein COU46_03440 [Candidatus Niyogibacteria bacterium CG10_big_fil_rev_8_21_14_0_10_42_19]